MVKVMELIGIQGEMLKQNVPPNPQSQAAEKVGQTTSQGSVPVPKASAATDVASPPVSVAVATTPTSSVIKNPKLKSTFLWEIPILQREIDKVEITAKQIVVAGGYKLVIICSKPVLSHMALIVRPVCGGNDSVLPWPMRATISFSFVKSNKEKNKMSFTTTNKVISTVFNKPKSVYSSANNSTQVGAEIPHYCPHNTLKNYITNSQLSLKISLSNCGDEILNTNSNNIRLCPADRLLTFF